MAADISFKVDSKALQEATEALVRGLPEVGDFSGVTANWARVLKSGALMRFRTQRAPDGTPWAKSRRATDEGGQTLSDTRRLRNSIAAANTPTTATLGTNVVYAAIHQFGGVIRAKKGPFLAIPVTPAARSAGSPTRMPGLHVWQTLKGQFVMGDDKGTVHFLLRRQVTMPARPYLGASEADMTELVRVVQDHLASAWRP